MKKIDGKKMASEVLNEVKEDRQQLPFAPGLAIITVGDEDSWQTYVHQKIKRAAEIGCKTKLINLITATEKEIIEEVDTLNSDSDIHGIIIQRPLPKTLDADRLVSNIDPIKDVDGFLKNSLYVPPIWLAVKHILEHIMHSQANGISLAEWLKNKHVTVIGKGETAGRPVIKGLYDLGIIPSIIDSKTADREIILKNSDIIISGTGKNILNPEIIKPGVMLIGIGIRKENSILKGDYDETEIDKTAAYYTPTPGGVGPLNLAYLFKNLLTAAKKSEINTDIMI